MTKHHSDTKMFHRYFLDFYEWNIIVVVLFVIAYALCIRWGGSWGRYWIAPVGFLVIILCNFRNHILCFQAVMDLKKKSIEENTINVKEIIRDKGGNYYNKGGAMVGDEKCLIIDTDGSKYRLVARKGYIIEANPKDYYQNAKVTVRYLVKSRVIIHMKIQSLDDKSKHLRKDFQEYFI